MEIPIKTTLASIEILVTPTKTPIKGIVGFVQIEVKDEEKRSIFKGRGFTIKVKTFHDIPTFTVNAPAYRSGFGYKTSFIIDNKELWYKITAAILEDFNQQTGGLSAEHFIGSDENINPNDIPF